MRPGDEVRRQGRRAQDGLLRSPCCGTDTAPRAVPATVYGEPPGRAPLFVDRAYDGRNTAGRTCIPRIPNDSGRPVCIRSDILWALMMTNSRGAVRSDPAFDQIVEQRMPRRHSQSRLRSMRADASPLFPLIPVAATSTAICMPSIWTNRMSRPGRSLAIRSFRPSADSATNWREAVYFDSEAPAHRLAAAVPLRIRPVGVRGPRY
jgi:hypothetical protein